MLAGTTMDTAGISLLTDNRTDNSRLGNHKTTKRNKTTTAPRAEV